MSVESAVAYIKRLRQDEEFRRSLNDSADDEATAWALVRANGFDFTMAEFKQAQDVIYKEYGITPL